MKAALLVALMLLLFAGHAAIYWAWTEDDAFISYRYARHLAEGKGLVFNPGEKVESYSNFLWVLLAAAAFRAGLDPETATKGLGLACAALSVIVSWSLARRLRPGAGRAAYLAPAILIFWPLLARHAVSGLETGAFALFLALALYMAAGPRNPRASAALIAVLVILALMRVEGFALALILVFARAFLDRRQGNAASYAKVEIAVLVLLFVLGFLARWRYFGEALPNIYHAKMGGGLKGLAYGAFYSFNFMRDAGGMILLGLALTPLALGRVSQGGKLCLIALGAYLLFILASAGDWMYHYRYFAHVLPVLAAMAAAGLADIAEIRVATSRFPRAPLALALGLFVLSLGSVANTEIAVARRVLPALARGDYITQNYAELGRWLKAHSEEDALIAASDVGALAYFSERRILDMYGLVDPVLSRGAGSLHQRADPAYVLSRRPDLVILISRPDRNVEHSFQRLPDARLFESAAFQESYALWEEWPLGYQNETALLYRRRS